MFINSIPVSAVAASVWANATRTLSKLGPALNSTFDVANLVAQAIGVSGTPGAWFQLIASSSRDSVYAFCSGDAANGSTSVPCYVIELGIGGAGSEVVIARATGQTFGAGAIHFAMAALGNFPAGTRFAARAWSTSAIGGSFDVALTLS